MEIEIILIKATLLRKLMYTQKHAINCMPYMDVLIKDLQQDNEHPQILERASLMRQLMSTCVFAEECVMHMDVLIRDLNEDVVKVQKLESPPNTVYIDLTTKQDITKILRRPAPAQGAMQGS